MSVNDCSELINLLHKEGYTPVLTGGGKVAGEFSYNLRKSGCFDYVDLVGCTTLTELAGILKICNRCITVDTGTLHFANALQVPVIGVFYAGCENMWASDETLYPAKTLIGKDIKPNDIIKAFKEINNEVCAVL